ncbi:hypothetical protein [Lysinibacillus xylanilyticus]|uniref:hypothetical protein n=1 Tax=Lysinibacillus xylanilyticus TaxID=582475 RepID=UPI0036DA8057
MSPCTLKIFNETKHDLIFKVNGHIDFNQIITPNSNTSFETDARNETDRQRLVVLDYFDNIEINKVNYAKPINFTEFCVKSEDGSLHYEYLQDIADNYPNTVVGVLSANDYPFWMDSNSTICYTVEVTIYESSGWYKADIRNFKLAPPDHIKQVPLRPIPADEYDYSDGKVYQEGDPYTCAPVCFASGEHIPNEKCPPT